MLKRRDDLSACRVQQELLLLDTEFKQIHQLNETASFVWDRCEQVPDAVAIAQLLAQEFDVAEDVALNDVRQILRRLRELHLLIG